MHKYIIACFIFVTTNLFSQHYNPYLQKFSSEDGLSNTNITTICTDSRGIVWIGTQYGLNRFDGRDFKSYTAEDDGLCENEIHKINEDDAGNLWIVGTSLANQASSLCVFNLFTEEAQTFEDYIEGAIPFNLDKTILLDSHLGKLIFRETQAKSYCFYTIKNQQIAPLFTLPKKAYSFTTADQMMAQADGTFISTLQTDTASNLLGGFIYLTATGTLLKKQKTAPNVSPKLRTDGQHLYFETNETKGDDSIISLTRDGQFLGTITLLKDRDIYTYILNHFVHYRNDGIYSYLSRFENYQMLNYFYDDKALPSSNILFSDLGGGVWCTKGETLLRLSMQAQHFHTIFDDVSPKRANAIQGIQTAADDAYLYASSLDFLHKVHFLDGRQEKISVLNDRFPLIDLTNILLEDSVIWITTQKDGLVKYHLPSKQFQFFEQSPKQTRAQLKQAFRANDGRLWLGSNKGLLQLDSLEQSLVAFSGYHTEFPNLASSQINAFHHHTQGTWLSTSSGVYLVDLSQEKILAHYSSSQAAPYQIPANNIMHLHEDADGIFWLATMAQGLVQWNPLNKTHQSFTKNNCGLPSNILYAVYEDDFNQLWLPSKQGLICFDKKTFQHKVYYKPDGLSYEEFNAMAHHQGKDGRLYFGSQNGMLMFYPESFHSPTSKDSLQVIALVKTKTQDSKLVNVLPPFLEEGVIKLLPTDKFIHLKLAIPNYNYPKGKQYSYRLKGYHKNWIYQNESSINLSGFPYGSYQLQLRGKIANSKNWLSYPNTISVQVIKPIYLRWWFILLVLLSLFSMVYYLLRRNTQQLLKRQEKLEQTVVERTEQIRKDKAVIEEQATELRALDKVKSSFFANVSHELRTPLTLILGPLSYLLDHPDAWDKREVQQQLTVMQRNGKSLLHLVEEILDLSKLEARKLELQEEPTSVVAFFDHIFTVFEPQFRNQKLAYDLNFELYEEDLFVMMDRQKIKKVIHNFLSNAIKFTPQKGKISLTVIEQANLVTMIVTDTGKGVHPKDLPYIFERFYQSKQAEQKLYGGTGIGLALVNEFANLMNGNTYAKSELGVGSQFYFEWPKKVSHAYKTMPKEETVTDNELDLIANIGTNFTILVVEDNPDMRQFVCSLLQKYYTVIAASNGLEGLAQLRNTTQSIHLVVSDIMMPEMDGLEMLKAIKSSEKMNDKPVIMLTALAGERDKLNALTIGVDDYLTKPFSVSELLTRVQNLLYNYHQRQQWQFSSKAAAENGSIKTQILSNKITVNTLSQLDKAWIENAKKMVEESLSDSLIKVTEIAQRNNLSVRQFNRKMNSLIGLSAGRFIKEVQLDLARKILEDGLAVSVSEVAYRCGFEYPSTFSNLFKKRYGKSPVEFIKGQNN